LIVPYFSEDDKYIIMAQKGASKMPAEILSAEDRKILLKLAREALERAVRGEAVPPLDHRQIPTQLLADGASFVTLTKKGQLRGCIGALEAYQPLALDVQEHAQAAALQDYRFPPVQAHELPDIHIEISRLSAPKPLPYENPLELPRLLKPGQDGVVLRDGWRRATFLPQVWESLPDPEEFLNHLCYKMGAAPDVWKHKILEVLIYHVEEFHEPG
jgi:hypothetical protein